MEQQIVGPKLAQAIVKFHALLPKVSKDSVNPHFKSKYASLSTILENIDPLLHTCGLAIVQMPKGESELVTLLIHESGESIGASVVMKLQKADPQGVGSAITYYRRYGIGAILSLNIDDDDDGNAASEAPRPRASTKPAEPKPDLGQPEPTPQMVASAFLRDTGASAAQKSDWKAFCDARDLDPTEAMAEAVGSKTVSTWAELYHYYGD